MNYRKDKYGNDLSILGFGCMRFQRKGAKIDFEEAEREILEAYRSGVNYYDTAYIYPGSEALIGEIFEKNRIREHVRIATKLPHYLIKSDSGVEKLFQEELKRLRTGYVDYYLMHMLNDIEAWNRLTEMGIRNWIEEKKASGAIRQVGFSYHGGSEMFCKILDAYDWDFCQIQYNYLDEHSQAGRKGLQYAASKGIPVIIMEPLRGGKLVNQLPKEAKQRFAQADANRTPAEWGLRWLWNQKDVTVVLSGMNTMDMVKENVRIASEVRAGEQGEQEDAIYADVVKAIRANVKVGCTGCGYCQPCPKGVDIPGIFSLYNCWYSEDKSAAKWDYIKCTTLRKNSTAASNCIGCGKCEKHCPQGIPIRQELKNAEAALETPFYKVFRKAVGWFTHF